MGARSARPLFLTLLFDFLSVWDANLVLVDLDQEPPRTIQGVFYGTPFKENIVRVALTHQKIALDMKQDPGPPHVTSTLLQQGKTMSKR